ASWVGSTPTRLLVIWPCPGSDAKNAGENGGSEGAGGGKMPVLRNPHSGSLQPARIDGNAGRLDAEVGSLSATNESTALPWPPAAPPPCRNVEDGAQGQGAPSVAKLSRCIRKRCQPGYRRYLSTVSHCGRLPTHGFPSVVAFGDEDRASRRTRHSAEGERALFQLVRRVGVRVSSGHV